MGEGQQSSPAFSLASGGEEYVRRMREGRSEGTGHCDTQLFEHELVL